MKENFSWYEFDEGFTVGQTSAEGGEIVRDEEHLLGARITLEQDCLAPFAITCSIYSWFLHTVFFETEDEAENRFEEMKRELTDILEIIPAEETATEEEISEVSDVIADFVERYP